MGVTGKNPYPAIELISKKQAGHYARPGVCKFTVNRSPNPMMVTIESGADDIEGGRERPDPASQNPPRMVRRNFLWMPAYVPDRGDF
jgi:hypothetical protein